MNRHEFLARIQHSNLQHGEFVIRVGDTWSTGILTRVNYDISTDSVTVVKFEGFMHEDE
jgi:hypothetical protein